MTQILYRLKPQNIRELISTQNLKHWWVAEVTGVHKTTLRRWLGGSIQHATGDHLRRLAAVLHTPMDRICEISSLRAN